MSSSKEQFGIIYDQYIEKIYRFVYLKVNSQEIAEDLSSKTFLKGWEAYQKGQEIKNPGAFLYQIARNLVTDHYREKGKTKIVSADYAPQIVDSKVNIYEKAVLNAAVESIKSAILKLNKNHQDVLIWYYLEDMPATQIAELLHKPVGTVRVMIHRGLESLRDELKGEA